MTEHSVNDLGYGHFGELFYDAQQHKWISSRHTLGAEGLKVLGPPQQHIEANLPGDGTIQNRLSRSKRFRNVERFITSALPEFGPAGEVLRDYASDLVQGAPRLFTDDWKKGELMASAVLHGFDQRPYWSRVLAVPGGDAGQILRLMDMRQARQGWGVDKKSAWLKTFDIRPSDSMTWQADGRIRQICFALNLLDETNPLLAVRTALSLTVLLPRISTASTGQQHHSTTTKWASSRITLEKILSFEVAALGGIEFADFSFNPWYPSMLAAVLEDGRILLWTLIVGQHTVEGADTVATDVGEPDFENGEQDGWYRILWLASSTFVVSSRQRLGAFRRRDKDVTCTNDDILASQTEPYIVDMKRSPTDHADFFVTTTTHIIYLRGSRNIRDTGSDMTFTTVLSWRHYRDATDKSLRIYFVADPEGFKIMLFSGNTAITTTYGLFTTAHDDPLRLTNFDSCMTEALVTSGTGTSSTVHTDVIVLASDLGGRLTLPHANVDPDSWLARCVSLGYRFYQTFALSADLSLKSWLVYAQLWDVDIHDNILPTPPLFIPAPIWTALRRRPKPIGRAQISDSALLEDDNSSDSGIDDISERHFKQLSSTGLVSNSLEDTETSWTISFDLVYGEVTKAANYARQDLSSLVTELARIVHEKLPNMSLQPLSTLQPDLYTPNDDFAGATELIEHAVNGLEPLHPAWCTVSPLASSRVLGLGMSDAQSPTPASIKQQLERSYLTFVSSESLTQEEMRRRQMVHAVAWQTTLSSFCVSSRHNSWQIHSQSQASQISGNTHSQVIDDEVSADDVPSSALTRLSMLTSTKIQPLVRGQSKASILQHWALGTDLLSYDYEAIVAEQAGTINVEGSAMSAEASQRVKRKKQKEQEKDVKRRKLDDRIVTSQALRRAEPFNSQRTLRDRQALSQSASQFIPSSSQVVDSQLTTASQPAPGLHGGRPLSMKRSAKSRRGRRAGF